MLASDLQLVTLRNEATRGNFVFPGPDISAAIQQHGHQVGFIDYSVSPLNERLYISNFTISPAHQGQGLGLGTLWCLHRQYGLPLANMHEVGLSTGFWAKAERRLAGAGVHLQRDIRTGDQPGIMATWAHLVPESDIDRSIREYWEWVAAERAAGRAAGPGIR